MLKERTQELLLEKRRYDKKERVSLFEKIQLMRKKPIQKIMGYIEMANVKIDVSKKVLIPRYETEELIYQALDFINNNNYKNILDLCCGSGFIGIGIKKNVEDEEVKVTQSDLSDEALKQTDKNLKINRLKNEVIKSNMFENLVGQRFDIIISNPPYISPEEYETLSTSVKKWEPKMALIAKDNGLEFYKIIENEAHKFLNKGGMVILEINPLNAQWFVDNKYTLIKDINGKERIAYKKLSQFLNN